ncbi:MAG: 16S rRNA (adenine(1518)-N(6)/adenine(1519)-N(6))-dimethyltransferase RsmA [Flavobacteriaceae bacterium]|nr:16S rRNA (adenine(1518)-N(6)/adenine(1519)-N(6))-dimethyltransferase RsmA [Flavobacteriaceae bacterium]
MKIRAKKHLGQHFLTDENIARKIVESLGSSGYDQILEIGPGTGVLTKYLLEKNQKLFLSEIDVESIDFLKVNFPENINENTFVGDFLKINIDEKFAEQIAVIGNFPYNISSQILFKIVESFQKIPEMVGMFQKEVAQRIAAVPRNKDYGILSVLVQAYYDVEYLFTVSENVFNPPPKVKSGVIKLTRNVKNGLENNEEIFKKIVKAGFNQRRKKLSNALKIIDIPENLKSHPFMDCRAEELSVEDFINFAKLWKGETKIF